MTQHNEPVPFRRTGVFASEAEDKDIERLMERANEVNRKVGLRIVRPDEDPRPVALALVQKAIDEAAMSHGLPKIEGHYGYDIKSREFLTYA